MRRLFPGKKNEGGNRVLQSSGKSVKGGISKLWTAEIISRILTAFLAVYSARMIGLETYGIVGYVAAVVSYFSVFVRFGTDSILVRELSRNTLATEHEKAAFRCVTILLRGTFAIVSIVVLVMMGIQSDSRMLSQLYYANAFGIFGLLMPLEFFLQSERKFGAIAIFRIVLNILNAAIIVLFLNGPATAWWIPLAGGMSLLVTQAALLRRMDGRFELPDAPLMRRLLAFLMKESVPLFGSMFLLLLIGQLGIIVVKQYTSAVELGFYVTGYKIYDVGNAMIVPVAVTIFPNLSEIWSTGTKSFRTRTLLDGIRITVPLALLMLGVSLFCGKEALGVLFGDRFEGASQIMAILLGTLFFRGISMFFANSLVAAGRQSQHLVVTAVIAALNIGLICLLIPKYGGTGAAWVNAIVFFLELIGYSILIWASIDLIMISVVVFKIAVAWGGACGITMAMLHLLYPFRFAALISGVIFVVIFAVFVSPFLHPESGRSD